MSTKNGDGVERRVLNAFGKLTGRKDLCLDHSLGELGIDSIVSLELVMQLERQFNIHIPDHEIERITTLRDAVELVRALHVIQAR